MVFRGLLSLSEIGRTQSGVGEGIGGGSEWVVIMNAHYGIEPDT